MVPSSPQNNKNNVSRTFGKIFNMFNKSKVSEEKEDSARQGLKNDKKNKIDFNNEQEGLPNFGSLKIFFLLKQILKFFLTYICLIPA
jgi:glutathione peroxidase-family protein